jgi:uncharacterized protein (DUF486 family)
VTAWIATPLLLVFSNILMTFAWYGHLKAPSWPMCLAVPANRLGYGTFTGQQLKVMQEVITLAVFAVFSVAFLGETLRWNFLAAGACLVAAVVFIFLPVE